MRLPILFSLPLAALFATSASAAVIFGNLAAYNNDSGNGSNGSSILGQQTSVTGSYSGKAIGFTMGSAAYTVDSLTLRLGNVTGTTDAPSISIWSNTGANVPSALVGTFTNPGAFNGATITNYVFTPASPLTLGAGASYFIVVQQTSSFVSGATDNAFNWYFGSPQVTPAGIASTAIARFRSDANSTSPTTFNQSSGNYNWFQLDGTVVSAIPEPSAFAALAGVAGLGLALSRRRRR